MTKKYWTAIFNESTWEQFLKHGGNTMGFPYTKVTAVSKISKGDYLICYLTKLSKFVAILEVKSDLFFDESQIWQSGIFPNRLKVKIINKLELDKAIPAFELKDKLILFKNFKDIRKWGAFFITAPKELVKEDAEVIIGLIKQSA
jgi:predicted RNA-binding protein